MRFNVGELVGDGSVVFFGIEDKYVVFRVDHTLKEDGDDFRKERSELVDEFGIFSEGEPKLASFESYIFVI
jgi:hypothetical protein